MWHCFNWWFWIFFGLKIPREIDQWIKLNAIIEHGFGTEWKKKKTMAHTNIHLYRRIYMYRHMKRLELRCLLTGIFPSLLIRHAKRHKRSVGMREWVRKKQQKKTSQLILVRFLSSIGNSSVCYVVMRSIIIIRI